MKYAYPAIFTPEDKWFLVKFPDLPSCYTDGESIIEAIDFAEDALNLVLMTMEDRGEPIPAPSNITSISVPEGAFTSIICADTMKYRKSLSTKSVKKTVSIPEWLDIAIRKKNWNLSQIFQDSLIKRLNLETA